MIEPHHAERLGFSAWFPPGARPAAAAAVIRLRALGIRHLRLHLRPVDIEDEAWLGWLLGSLGDEFDVLPCVQSDARGLSRLLTLCGQSFTSIELTDPQAETPQNAAAILAAAAAIVRAFDKSVVIGMASLHADMRLAAFCASGALGMASAIGLHVDDASDVSSSHEGVLSAVRRLQPSLPVWLTDVGCSTWRHETARQARAFVGALATDADRVYWRALTDDPTCDHRDRAAHEGIDDTAGQPKLLGRMLTGGVAEVERILAMSGRTGPSIIGARPVLVTGGAGFIGANLADRLASEGNQVLIYDALARPGVERNLRWLARRHPTRISFLLGDLRDEPALGDAAAGASAVFHLAGQVAVTTSMVRPLADFDVNARGTLALLEALRQRNSAAPLIFASTNKVYGDLADIDLVRDGECYLPLRPDIRAHGVSEARKLCFHTPYGCSKGTADQYVLDYAHSFGLRTAVLRMSCIYGERQLGTEDQGWVAHFLLRAIAGETLTIYGDGRQVRDILHVGDAVGAYMAAWRSIDAVAGRAYNLGGGPANAISLLQLVGHIEALLAKPVDVTFSAWRPGDQRYFVADNAAIRRDLSLPASLGWRAGLARLAEHFGAALAAPAQMSEAAL